MSSSQPLGDAAAPEAGADEPERTPDGAGRHGPPTRVVVAATAGVAVLSALTVWGRHGSGTDTSSRMLVLDVLAAAAAVVLVPVLLRRPVRGALLLAALAALSPAVTPPATLGTLHVAQRRPLRTALPVAAVGVAAHAVQALWRPQAGLGYGWWLVLVAVAHAGLVGWGAWVQNRRLVLAGLRERAERAEAAQAVAAARAREQERERIAREMHDVLAHRLSLLATWAGALEYRPDSPPEKLAQAAGTLRAGIHQALDELRDVVGMLRRPDGQPDPPAPRLVDLPLLVAESRSAGTVVDLHLDLPLGPSEDGTAAGCSPAVERAAYRVVQESLTNARKHAPDSPVRVQVTGGPGHGIEIEVTNPLSTASAAAPSSGAGLVGLAERATLAGGRLAHGLRADDGTQVFVVRSWLPWPRDHHDGAGAGRR